MHKISILATLLISTIILSACGGGGGSSDSSGATAGTAGTVAIAPPTPPVIPVAPFVPDDCNVVNNEIVLNDAESCEITAADAQQFNINIANDSQILCNDGTVTFGALTATGSNLILNGLTISCAAA